jgi:hypothetical protein
MQEFAPGATFPVRSHVVDKKCIIVSGQMKEVKEGNEVGELY